MSSIDPMLKLGLLKAANFVIGILDFVAELLMGRSFSFGKREERFLSLDEYDKSAQLVRVVARQGRAEFLHFEHLDQFILAHEEYVHPRFVLSPGGGKVASLYFFEDNHAVFGVCDTDPYDTRDVPFHSMALNQKATKLVVMPLASFHRLAGEIGDPKASVHLFGMTARSGSTLLTQALHRVEGTRAISEPWPLAYLATLWIRKIIDDEEHKRLLQSAVRFYTYSNEGEGVRRVCIKLCGASNSQFGHLRDLFPSSSFHFSTRRPLPSVASNRKPLAPLVNTIYDRSGAFWKEVGCPLALTFPQTGNLSAVLRNNGITVNTPRLSWDEHLALHYIGGLLCFLENRGIFSTVTLHEDLVQDPKKVVGNLFEKMGIPQEELEGALGALEQDSQKGQFHSVEGYKEFMPEAQLSDLMDAWFERIGMTLRCTSSVEDFRKLVHGSNQ